MGSSNKDNDRSISNILYSKLIAIKYGKKWSRNSSLGISEKNIESVTNLWNLNVFVLKTGIGAPVYHKENINKK